jgi:hypothetical protein
VLPTQQWLCCGRVAVLGEFPDPDGAASGVELDAVLRPVGEVEASASGRGIVADVETLDLLCSA